MLHRYLSWMIVLTCLLASPVLAGELPSIESEIVVHDWWVIGPFMSGVREAGPNALEFDRRVDGFKTPLIQPSFPSALVPGGEARWQHYAADEKGAVSVDYPNVPQATMDLVTDEWGFAGGMTVGYAYATIHIEDGPRRAMLDLKYASTISINGVPWPGDPYGLGYGMSPVLLEDGDNELKIGVGSRQRFSLRFLPVEGDLIAHTQSIIAPSIVRGIAPPVYIGIPLANTTNDWLMVDGISIEQNELFGSASIESASIPPLCVYYLAVTLNSDLATVPMELEDEEFAIALNLNYGDGELAVPISMALRNPEQSRKVTFLSAMDNSVQYYGLLPPSDFDPTREYGLILSLHGAGVEAYPNQVNAYQPKDWAYVVAPTNRRRFGFDWQDWGQRDMLEVLAEVDLNYSIDRNRIHLTGHSMGGHGTWLNAFTFPDLWASAAPSAGWTRFDLYVPMFLRKNLLYGEPKANYIWQLAMRQDDTLALAENALNLPIYALEGGADDNVPPQQPRLLYEQLRRLGYDITYEEVPGKGHWWNDKDTPGTDCVDSPALNEFWESHVRDPWPNEVRFITGCYSAIDRCFWIEDIVPIDNSKPVKINARVVGETAVVIDTSNIRKFFVNLRPEIIAIGEATLVVDGEAIECDTSTPFVPLRLSEHGWKNRLRVQFQEELYEMDLHVDKRWKAALSNCTVVYGDEGSTEFTAASLQLARLYAYHWWYRGNGKLRIMPSSTFDIPEQGFNLLTGQWKSGSGILIGNPESNSILAYATAEATIQDLPKGLIAGDRFISGNDLTYKYSWSPYEKFDGPTILIEGGTSLEAMKRLPSMMGIYSGAGFPDWMVWDDEVKLKGLGGVIGMGFFDQNWQINPELSYFNEDLINRLDD